MVFKRIQSKQWNKHVATLATIISPDYALFNSLRVDPLPTAKLPLNIQANANDHGIHGE